MIEFIEFAKDLAEQQATVAHQAYTTTTSYYY